MDELENFGLDSTFSHHIRRYPTDGNLNQNNIIIICGEHLDTSTLLQHIFTPLDLSFWSPCFLFTLWTLPPPVDFSYHVSLASVTLRVPPPKLSYVTVTSRNAWVSF